jgi:hypothetical protein
VPALGLAGQDSGMVRTSSCSVARRCCAWATARVRRLCLVTTQPNPPRQRGRGGGAAAHGVAQALHQAAARRAWMIGGVRPAATRLGMTGCCLDRGSGGRKNDSCAQHTQAATNRKAWLILYEWNRATSTAARGSLGSQRGG